MNAYTPSTEDPFKRHLHPYLLACKDGRGRPALIRDYMFFCAILYVMRTGISWRDLPDF
ncbi:MAG: transposase, partial [Chlamydiales bacterium]|nr:transposase [Chlamydiales bacterium]